MKKVSLLSQEAFLKKLCRCWSFLRLRYKTALDESLGCVRHFFRNLGMDFVETNFKHCCLRGS